MILPKLYIGTVSKNTIDSAIEVANENKIFLGLLPSRRQVDYCGGYLGLNTNDFSKYVKEKTKYIVLERDHGGEGQGYNYDSGVHSFVSDLTCFDIIHIDPFKKSKTINDAIEKTIINLQYLFKINSKILFEIGTEEGIWKYKDTTEFYDFIKCVFDNLDESEKLSIKYLVVQGGTKVKSGENIGKTDNEILKNFIKICDQFGIASKEHNGDYLTKTEIANKFSSGLSAINIAPEFGSIETEAILENINKIEKNYFFDLVFESGRWKKWFSEDFIPQNNKDIVLKMCGHYVFEDEKFKTIKQKYKNIDEIIKIKIKSFILDLISVI